MNWALYIQLSLMMFLQFAVWGAWSPVLASRLLGPLKMTGKQTGWIYGSIYIGCILAPLIGGQIVDRWVATQWFLAGAHLVGGVLLLVAARQRRFGSLLIVMLLYALAFAPTLALVFSLTFYHLKGIEDKAFGILLWGTIGWAVAGWGLSLWRRAKGSGEGGDCLVLAGLLSLAMGLYCLSLPHTPPAKQVSQLQAQSLPAEQGGKLAQTQPIQQAGELLPFLKKHTSFVIFLVVVFVLATQLQFFFLGTAPFLGELGVRGQSIPAVMAIAQVAQVGGTLALFFWMDPIKEMVGFGGMFMIGIALWLAMYAIYTFLPRRGPVILAQGLHGLAYTFVIWLGNFYVDHVAPPDIRASAQGLYTVVLFGFGFFLGTQFTGMVMDWHKIPGGTFRWRSIYLVPCVVLLLCLIAMTMVA